MSLLVIISLESCSCTVVDFSPSFLHGTQQQVTWSYNAELRHPLTLCFRKPQIIRQFQYVIVSELWCPGKCTYIFSVLPARLYDREGDSSDCQYAVTQTHSPSVSPLQSRWHLLGQEQYMSQYRQTDGPTTMHQCIWENDHTQIHTYSTRLWKKYVLLSWALFALVNVNISTIFTPASILPGRRFSVKDLNASQIELTWFFFPI